MKDFKRYINLIFLFILFFFTFLIQSYLENRIIILVIWFVANILLFSFSFSFITVNISRFVKHIEKCNFEISKRNFLNINSNFCLIISVIFMFFWISFLNTYISFEKIIAITIKENWLQNSNILRYLNTNVIFFSLIVLFNLFIVYLIFYIFALMFFYLIIKTVISSNKQFINAIYKKSIKLNQIIKLIFQKIKIINKKIYSIQKSWKETIILINNIESKRLKKDRKGIVPPNFLFFKI
ncbi:hypothetical protein [Spiroplasma endosymbiont of Atherix ibis]|uniref:hypothetical protein n=1 Tax=Spiroplasma endosymbiont of Atherix ibis TaxID=3066291 RepID=UPI0030D3DA03